MSAAMMSLMRTRTLFILLAALALLLTMAACGPDSSENLISPGLGEQLIAEAEDAEVEIVPTPVPPKLADLTQEEIMSGLPDDILALMSSADPAAGEEVAVTTGCLACHDVDPTKENMVGPTWYLVGDTSVNRPSDGGPALYLYTSIVDPSDYVVDGYNDVMLKVYEELLSQEDMANIVAYLLEQHE